MTCFLLQKLSDANTTPCDGYTGIRKIQRHRSSFPRTRQEWSIPLLRSMRGKCDSWKQTTRHEKLTELFQFFKQIEVFNILFIREQEKRHVVHCMGCARKQSPSLQGFVCLEEYRLTELMQVYDQFVLHKPLPPPMQQTPIGANTAAQQQKETPVVS